MAARPSTGLLLVAGYGLYKAASSTEYLSAMGAAPTNMGFVSQLPFMLANCAAETLVAFLIVFLAHTGRLLPGKLSDVIGYALLLIATVASDVADLTGVLGTQLTGPVATLVVPIALGLVKGAGSIIVSLRWFELYVLHAGRRSLAWLLLAFALGALAGVGLSFMPAGPASQLAMLLIYLASLACARLVAMRAEQTPAPSLVNQLSPKSEPGRNLLSAWLCLLVCHFVVGIANTAVFGSSFASIMAHVNVNTCILLAVALLALVFGLTRRFPDPEFTFKLITPVFLVVFTLAALAADRFGLITGYAMICCYEAIAVTYTIYMIAFLRNGLFEPYQILGVTSGLSSLALLIGLVIGGVLSLASNLHDIPLFTILAFVAIYPFGIALLFVQRNRARNTASAARREALVEAGRQASTSPRAEQAREGAAETISRSDVEDYHLARVRKFAERFGLTRRETDVCAELTRGRTVRSVAEALCVSESTVWTHIRGVYSKCGVNTKQELIDMFESEPETCDTAGVQ